MTPTDFPESNFTFVRPPEMTEEECGDLKVHRTDATIISCWQLSWKERFRLLWTGRAWLWIVGQGMPPVAMTITSPFKVVKCSLADDVAEKGLPNVPNPPPEDAEWDKPLPPMRETE